VLLIAGLVGLGCSGLLRDPTGAVVCGLIALAGRYFYYKTPSSRLSDATGAAVRPRVAPLVGGFAIVSVVASSAVTPVGAAPGVTILTTTHTLNPIKSYIKLPARRRDRLTGQLLPQSLLPM